MIIMMSNVMIRMTPMMIMMTKVMIGPPKNSEIPSRHCHSRHIL